MGEIIFARHGESEYNQAGRINADPAIENPLTVRGIEQAEQLGVALTELEFEVCFTSELLRARGTTPAFEHDGELFALAAFLHCHIDDDGEISLVYEYGDRSAELALDEVPITRPSSLDLWTASFRRYGPAPKQLARLRPRGRAQFRLTSSRRRSR